MKFLNKTTQLLIGGTIGSAVAFSLLSSIDLNHNTEAAIVLAQALSPEEINLRAKQTIIRIDGAGTGSGTLIDYSDNIYTVLTNWHVVKDSGEYTAQTIDGRTHQIDPATIEQLPGLDLAILTFNSDRSYQTVELGDSSNLSEGQNIYFAGYPGELRQEDNRYYRFFPANLVGILPKTTENGYSLIYNGEAFPGMSGGPVFNKNGLMIGVHGEANIHALSGGTSNYAIPINSYKQAIAQLETEPTAQATTPTETEPTQAAPEVVVETDNVQADNSKQPESSNSDNISSVPTFVPNTSENSEPEATEEPKTEAVEEVETATQAEPESEAVEEVEAATQAEPESEAVEEVETATQAEPESEAVEEVETATQAEPESEAVEEVEAATQAEPEPEAVEEVETTAELKPVASEEVEIPTVTRKIPLVSEKTGIDYTKLRNLLKEGKWSEADLHTYELVEQIVKTAKRQNKHTFIELKTIAEFSCPDVRTIDYLWKKYSDDKFGFSPQQDIWQTVNQEGDFSTQTWRRFATKVGWKQGEVASSSGYKLYDELNFEPAKAPEGHLPWWFALPDEEQKVIKSLFSRCNLNPTLEELEAEATSNTDRDSPDNRDEADNNDRLNSKTPESANQK